MALTLPRIVLNAHLSGNFAHGLNGRLQLAHLFDRDFEGPSAPADANFDSYTVVDLFIGKELGNGQLSLAVENLLDKQYITYFGQTESRQNNNSYFAGNGRTLTLSYQLEF